jgi:hypothetical protein
MGLRMAKKDFSSAERDAGKCRGQCGIPVTGTCGRCAEMMRDHDLFLNRLISSYPSCHIEIKKIKTMQGAIRERANQTNA